MKNFRILYLLSIACFLSLPLSAIVKYDEGRLQIDGIQLLQDREDPNAYYYIPQFPRIATHEDGSLEFLCMKYVGQGGEETNGGIFHALVEYTLPEEVVDSLQIKLKKIISTARLVGPVPMQQFTKEGDDGIGSFEVVSAILNDTEGPNPFTRNVIASGFAPLLPGSKAAIAAKLNQSGATLLWESLSGPTSDVSVSVHGYYEAAVKAYNAIITAEMSTVYEHYSKVFNYQEGYTRQQLRKISDEMVQNQVLNIDIFDRSEGLGIETKDMQAIVDLVTEKLTEMMFDAEAGWAKKPDREVAVEANQIKGRQERGWFSRVFGGAQNTQYFSDNQYVLKRREDIRVNKFYLNLSKATTVKVPIHTSGNLGGLYQALGNNEQYFKVVNLDDADFQQREVHFQIDGNFTDSFNEILNSVAVSFRKNYGEGQNEVTKDIHFNHKDLEAGQDFKTVQYPRLGISGSEWLDYEYKISWNLKGETDPVRIPAVEGKWLTSKSPSISLTPPFQKKVVEVDADRAYFQEAGIRSATIRFFVILGGEARPQSTLILRSADVESTNKLALFHDEGEPVAYQITWYAKNGKTEDELKELTEDYLFVVPPESIQ